MTRKAGIGHWRAHEGRRTAVSIISSNGVPIQDISGAPALMRHLGTAAFIVCAYLTGMRPGEILGLRTGCCLIPFQARTGSPDGT